MLAVIDAVGIRGHGGAAVLCELLYWLPKIRRDWRWHVFLFERDLREFDDPPVTSTVSLEQTRCGNTGLARLRWVRSQLQERVQSVGAGVIFSFGNIGSENPRVPQVVFIHQTNAFSNVGIPQIAIFKRLRLRFMRHLILRGALASRAVIVQTEAMKRRILHLEPNLKHQIHVIPSGYHAPSGCPTIRPEKRSAIDSSQRPRLIYVSHPSEHKNHINLVKALPHIIKVFPNARLLLTLDKEDPLNARYGMFVRNINRVAVSVGVKHSLVWLGVLTPDEVHYALSQCDLMVFPSLAESFGLGLVEAMAAGCAVTASDLSYAHDVAGGAAEYFDPLDLQSISRVAISVLSNERRAREMIEKGMALREQYSYMNIATSIASLLSMA